MNWVQNPLWSLLLASRVRRGVAGHKNAGVVIPERMVAAFKGFLRIGMNKFDIENGDYPPQWSSALKETFEFLQEIAYGGD